MILNIFEKCWKEKNVLIFQHTGKEDGLHLNDNHSQNYIFKLFCNNLFEM